MLSWALDTLREELITAISLPGVYDGIHRWDSDLLIASGIALDTCSLGKWCAQLSATQS